MLRARRVMSIGKTVTCRSVTRGVPGLPDLGPIARELQELRDLYRTSRGGDSRHPQIASYPSNEADRLDPYAGRAGCVLIRHGGKHDWYLDLKPALRARDLFIGLPTLCCSPFGERVAPAMSSDRLHRCLTWSTFSTIGLETSMRYQPIQPRDRRLQLAPQPARNSDQGRAKRKCQRDHFIIRAARKRLRVARRSDPVCS